MKLRIVASVLLIMLLSVGVSSELSAAPWRGGYCHHGWCGPAVRVVVPPVVVGGYYGPRPYYGPAYYGGYYGHPHYGGYYGGRGYYGHGYYGHGGYGHGGYGHRR